MLFFLITACSKEKNFDNIKVFGHAGMGLNILNSVFHDNSKEAIELAMSIEGCDGVEIDVQLSKDGDLWLYHDSFLESETNGVGCVSNLMSSELSQLNYKGSTNEKMISLDQIDWTLFKGREIFLDLRHYNTCTEEYVSVDTVIARILEVQSDIDVSVHCILSYTSWIQPFLIAGLNVDYSIYSIQEFRAFEISYPLISGYIVKNSEFSEKEIQEIKNKNKKVYIFEIRSPKGIRSALKKQPNGVITDDIRATLIEKY